jgi:Holliday junction resolvasome RuvABC endonuclease subunit
MVEMVSEKTTKLLLEEIENQNKSILEKYSYLIEEFEELMRRVRPKMIVITNQFTDIANIFRASQKKHEDSGISVFN